MAGPTLKIKSKKSYFISILLQVSLRSVFLKNYVFPMGSNDAANTLPTGMDAMSLDLGGV